MQNKKILELIANSIDWNIRKLPENTLEMQVLKVFEEVEELFKELGKIKVDEEKVNQEKADVFIALSGLGRFSIGACLYNLNVFLTDMEKNKEPIEDLINYIEKKLDLIEQLDYVIQDGVYHHTLLN